MPPELKGNSSRVGGGGHAVQILGSPLGRDHTRESRSSFVFACKYVDLITCFFACMLMLTILTCMLANSLKFKQPYMLKLLMCWWKLHTVGRGRGTVRDRMPGGMPCHRIGSWPEGGGGGCHTTRWALIWISWWIEAMLEMFKLEDQVRSLKKKKS
jgi:hypothetical protein